MLAGDLLLPLAAGTAVLGRENTRKIMNPPWRLCALAGVNVALPCALMYVNAMAAGGTTL